MKKLIISIVMVNLLAACASEKPKETSPSPVVTPKAEAPAVVASKVEAPKPASVPVVTPVPAPTPTPAPTPPRVEVDPLNDPSSILAKRSVYYPFDVSGVQEEDKPIVQAHAKYLSEHTNRKVRLEGNCDERGSNEYNLGLGQRRADGVKKMLELSGAKPDQTVSVSYGEEKPRCTDHNEACWKQNRRTDLIYAK